MKNVNREDFTAGELKSHLKPLNDRVRGRDRLTRKTELKEKFSPIPKKAADYYAQFLKKTPADQSILLEALFRKTPDYLWLRSALSSKVLIPCCTLS
ncbi:MAG: hypothetical protein FJY60_08255 [Betaproteobacteria bacterium]|nr:hypothetical protein [Betaproteobacteria bacterium]